MKRALITLVVALVGLALLMLIVDLYGWLAGMISVVYSICVVYLAIEQYLWRNPNEPD